MTIRMPQPEMQAKTQSITIGEILLKHQEPNREKEYPWAERFVMGFPLPSWQRPLVWSAEQNERFITSLWVGIDVGTYMVNEWCHAKGGLAEFSDLLLDGQQRLNAIEQYIENKLAVEDVDGTPRLWEELPTVEKRRFKMRTFARATVNSFDEKVLRKIYDLHNFGGTPHTESQRATR